MPAIQHYVYIMTNRRGALYVGMTHDLMWRVRQHHNGECAFTKKYRITKLAYYEVHYNRSYALEREKQIKGWKRWRKLELIRHVNPAMRDVAYHTQKAGRPAKVETSSVSRGE